MVFASRECLPRRQSDDGDAEPTLTPQQPHTVYKSVLTAYGLLPCYLLQATGSQPWNQGLPYITPQVAEEVVLTTYYSLLTAPYTHYSLLTPQAAEEVLLTTHHVLLTTYYSLLTAHHTHY